MPKHLDTKSGTTGRKTKSKNKGSKKRKRK